MSRIPQETDYSDYERASLFPAGAAIGAGAGAYKALGEGKVPRNRSALAKFILMRMLGGGGAGALIGGVGGSILGGGLHAAGIDTVRKREAGE